MKGQMRTVRAVRYVLPLREGGSVPALVEADDLGLYVVKLRGAGQGPKALVAELIAGELARAVGLSVPELVLVDLDAKLASAEPDPELAVPLEASAGINVGLDYLPGSLGFDPIASPRPDPLSASRIVLLDAFTLNVDRTPRNPNLMVWHRQLWLIDHGASLYFHHGWGPSHPFEACDDPFVEVSQHVLLSGASALKDAAAHLATVLTGDLFERIVADVPDAWLDADRSWPDARAHRGAYVAWLRKRTEALPALLEEAERARR
jgi:hypothetical protein